MRKEEVRSILLKEAEKCGGFADNWKNGERKDEDVVMYWVGKRRGFLDAVKYLDRLEGEE